MDNSNVNRRSMDYKAYSEYVFDKEYNVDSLILMKSLELHNPSGSGIETPPPAHQKDWTAFHDNYSASPAVNQIFYCW